VRAYATLPGRFAKGWRGKVVDRLNEVLGQIV
jgi:hypothetical protein